MCSTARLKQNNYCFFKLIFKFRRLLGMSYLARVVSNPQTVPTIYKIFPHFSYSAQIEILQFSFAIPRGNPPKVIDSANRRCTHQPLLQGKALPAFPEVSLRSKTPYRFQSSFIPRFVKTQLFLSQWLHDYFRRSNFFYSSGKLSNGTRCEPLFFINLLTSGR